MSDVKFRLQVKCDGDACPAVWGLPPCQLLLIPRRIRWLHLVYYTVYIVSQVIISGIAVMAFCSCLVTPDVQRRDDTVAALGLSATGRVGAEFVLPSYEQVSCCWVA